MAPGGWVDFPRNKSQVAPALPFPPIEGDNQAFSNRQFLGLNWRHLVGSTLTLGLAERALQGAGLEAASSRALEFSHLDFHHWYRKGLSARPLVHLLQWSLEPLPSLYCFILYRYFLDTHCVPVMCLQKRVGNQPQGDAPSPRRLPFICQAAHCKRTRT